MGFARTIITLCMQATLRRRLLLMEDLEGGPFRRLPSSGPRDTLTSHLVCIIVCVCIIIN